MVNRIGDALPETLNLVRFHPLLSTMHRREVYHGRLGFTYTRSV